MGGKILYNIATRNRPHQLDEVLTNLAIHCQQDFLVCVKVDNDDKFFEDYRSVVQFHSEVYGFHIWFFGGTSVSKVDAINRNIQVDGWDILVNLSDDQRFIMPGFDSIIRQHMEEDCFLHFPDEMARSLCTMSIMSRMYYDRFGYVYHPSYKSLWCDNEATEVAQLLGKYKFVDQVLFKHYHHAWGLASKDELYNRNDKYWNQDKRNYQQRKKRNFDLIDTHTIKRSA